MAVLKQRLHKKNSSGTYDTIHLETSASLVLMASGVTLESKIATMDTTIADKAASSHDHSATNITSGVLAPARGGLGNTGTITSAGTYAIIRKAGDGEYAWFTNTANGAFYATGANQLAKFGTLPVAQGGTGNTSVDTTPTSGSTKMVTSGGVYTALSSKAAANHTHTTESLGIVNNYTLLANTTLTAETNAFHVSLSGHDLSSYDELLLFSYVVWSGSLNCNGRIGINSASNMFNGVSFQGYSSSSAEYSHHLKHHILRQFVDQVLFIPVYTAKYNTGSGGNSTSQSYEESYGTYITTTMSNISSLYYFTMNQNSAVTTSVNFYGAGTNIKVYGVKYG